MSTADVTPYKPIDCGFHDHLLAWATLRRPVVITYRDHSGNVVQARDVIVDVYTDQGAEYLKSAGGLQLRLDAILEVEERRV